MNSDMIFVICSTSERPAASFLCTDIRSLPSMCPDVDFPDV